MTNLNFSCWVLKHITESLLILLLLNDLSRAEKVNLNSCISGFGLLRVYGLSLSECITECQLRPGCNSVNYKLLTKRCEINDISFSSWTDTCLGIAFSQRLDWMEDKSEACTPSCAAGTRCDVATATCQRKECGLPPLVPNTVVHGNLRSVGNKIQYVCTTDLSAVFTVECLQTGLWSPIPVCPIDCGEPNVVQYSHLLPGSNYEGHNRQYECDTGFVLDPAIDVSTMTITCQASGSWTSTSFQCLYACGEPPQEPNSNVLPGNTTVDSQRQYQCDAQYVLTPASDASSMTVTCQASGYWTSTNFQCVIDCEAPDPITGVDIPSGQTSYGSSLTIQCDTGYQPENSAVSTATISCQASGSWSTPDAAFNCLKECSEPTGKPNAQLLPNPPPAVNVEDDIRTYQCNSGYTPLPGSDEVEITCQNDGDWSDSDLVCVADCGSPSAMPNSAWSGTTHEGSVVTYTCDNRYSLSPSGADTTITCHASGSWTTPTFSCQVDSIGMSCSSDSDCLEVNSRCLYNNYDSSPRWRCLCNYKTEYNAASRSCDTQCTAYSNTFTEYSGIYINKYNHVDYYDKTRDECLQACIDFGEMCASVDYWKNQDRCYIGSVSYQQIMDGDSSQIYNYYQFDSYTRDCSNG